MRNWGLKIRGPSWHALSLNSQDSMVLPIGELLEEGWISACFVDSPHPDPSYSCMTQSTGMCPKPPRVFLNMLAYPSTEQSLSVEYPISTQFYYIILVFLLRANRAPTPVHTDKEINTVIGKDVSLDSLMIHKAHSQGNGFVLLFWRPLWMACIHSSG